MSLSAASICCTGCDYEVAELHHPIVLVYRLNSGKELKTGKSIGWCYSCDSYGYIEGLDVEGFQTDLNQYDENMTKYRNRLQNLSQGFLAGLRHKAQKRQVLEAISNVQGDIDKTKALVQLAEERESGQRCLKCWSEDTAPIVFDSSDNSSQNFKHRCGGRLIYIKGGVGVRVSFSTVEYVLDAEGNLIEKRPYQR
jgi:hypothetical protein